jgi:arginyl-tRNA synthetase
VRTLVDYHEAVRQLPEAETQLARLETALERVSSDKNADEKQRKKDLKALQTKIAAQRETIASLNRSIDAVQNETQLSALAIAHPDIGDEVLRETVRLHEGDPESRRLWAEFMRHGLAEIERVYERLGVHFDHQLGESFYHDALAGVVEELLRAGIARESEGAICVFLEGQDAPMIVRKRDGAFLYSTSDLATIRYRMENWKPDVILYVVDFRQGEHFDKLFAVARMWGYTDTDYRHVSFGTVMGDDGRPFRTRSGDTVGLEPLLDEAEQRALAVVSELDDQKEAPEFSEEQRREIARVVGISALKYADLSQNRSSDYTFSFEKMVNLRGNTATYLQYGYARVNGIFRRGEIDPAELRREPAAFVLSEDIERRLAVKLLRLGEALDDVAEDFRPHLLATWLFELTQMFFVFFEQCPVLRAEGDLRRSRLQLCDLTARSIRLGLSLLGIEVVERM